MASFLLEKGADINARDKSGKTPLDSLLYYGNSRSINDKTNKEHFEMARLLIRNGAEVAQEPSYLGARHFAFRSTLQTLGAELTSTGV